MIKSPLEQTQQTIDQLLAFIVQSPWRGEYLELLYRLRAEAEQPCVLAIAGRVKAGKSSFLNALLGKELAKVGTTETTATITVFRKGIPPDPAKPVRVIWANAPVTYESQDFLDSLQGNDQATLDRAKGISSLEFLLSDPIFDDITLVDTPGTDALVGETGDGHQVVTEGFFGIPEKGAETTTPVTSSDERALRERHRKETIAATEHADAVIYLTGQVANATGQAFMQEFQGAAGGGVSAMNAIGVMSKIDLSEAIMVQRHELAQSIAQKMQREFNTVVPVSSEVWRVLNDLQSTNRLSWMQEQLREIPREGFDYLMKGEKFYYSTSNLFTRLFTGVKRSPLSVEERKALKGDIHWSTFVLLCRHLYDYPLEEAVERLTELSGIERVKAIIQTHFFTRGRILRCYRIATQLRALLTEIERNKLYELGREVRSRRDFESFIVSHPKAATERSVADKLLLFLKTHLKTEEELSVLTKTIENSLIPQVEALQLELQKTDHNFQALKLLEQNHVHFSEEERSELCILFGMYGEASSGINFDTRYKRQQYWNLERNLTRNPERRKMAHFAFVAYGTLAS